MNEPRRLLVIETLYLGDLIHTLPLIQALRVRYPAAQLDVLCRAANAPLLAQVRGIDRVREMDPRRHRSLAGLRALISELRAAEYDLVLNPGASDRATILTWRSGGARRIGRLNRSQSRRLWPLLHDEVIDRAWGADPMWWQKLTAFAAPLGLETAVDFGLDFSGVALPQMSERYLHLSPFASEDVRSLPPATVVALATALRRRFPELGLVVSSGPSAREMQRFAAIQPMLEGVGATCFSGTLALPALGALIQRAAVHIGPDSGPLHLAAAVDTPSVGCFLFKDASAEWMPVGPRHRSLGVTTRLAGGLYGIPVPAVVDAVADLL